MMEKYGTYHLFKHKFNNDIKRVLIKEDDANELTRFANSNEWEEIFESDWELLEDNKNETKTTE